MFNINGWRSRFSKYIWNKKISLPYDIKKSYNDILAVINFPLHFQDFYSYKSFTFIVIWLYIKTCTPYYTSYYDKTWVRRKGQGAQNHNDK